MQAAEKVDVAFQQWNSYLNRGYSQYPWESLVNGELWSPTWENPPDRQLVLLHPELGLGFSTKKDSEAEIDLTLLVHTAGYIHYFGEGDYFVGLSGSLLFNGDHGFGFGPTFHTGMPGLIEPFPHVSFGMSWHDVDDDGQFFDVGSILERQRRPLAVVSVDGRDDSERDVEKVARLWLSISWREACCFPHLITMEPVSS
jgi:hypothetical protein